MQQSDDTECAMRSTKFIHELFNGSSDINLNIGGLNFVIKWCVIEKLPKSRLGKIRYAANMKELLSLCDEVNVEKKEIYFDRSSRTFDMIIDYYHTNNMHLDANSCVVSFYKDLKFWGLDCCEFDPCCSFKFHQLKEELDDHIAKVAFLEQVKENKVIKFSGACQEIRRKVWDITEFPETSNLAKATTIVSILFVLISTFSLVVSTLPSLKLPSNTTYNATAMIETEVDHPVFETIENICIAWFTFEFLLRFWASPNKLKFLKDPLNIIDILSIVPFYMSIALSYFSASILKQTESIRKLFTLFRVLRILRIFKLARHSKGLKQFGKTIKMSVNELGILFMFLAIAVLLFSSLAYFAEKDQEGTPYTSIPATFWWSVITITTVGYGDMYPTTFFGKIVGVFCCVGGILVLAMPIPIIVDNFRKICIDEEIAERAVQYREMRERNRKKSAVLVVDGNYNNDHNRSD